MILRIAALLLVAFAGCAGQTVDGRRSTVVTGQPADAKRSPEVRDRPKEAQTSPQPPGETRRPGEARPSTVHRPPSDQARFFFAGSGRLKLSHGHFETTLDARYRRADGSYDEAGLQQIRHFFRSRQDGREASVPLRTIELLSFIQARFKPKQMTLMSGYRSPEYNSALGDRGAAVAMASLHTQGLAADIAFQGLDIRKLWLSLRELKVGGVGYYKSQNFLHIDSGPPRFWEETTSKVKDNLSAGNARMFVRSDYDRYGELTGAILRLHSVTTLPLYVRATAAAGAARVELEPVDAQIERRDDCWAITKPAETYELSVVAVEGAVPAQFEIVIATCEERVEKTPAEVRSNRIELIEASPRPR